MIYIVTGPCTHTLVFFYKSNKINLLDKARCFHDERSVVTPAGTARSEDPLGQVIFLAKLAAVVPAASIHPQASREKQQQTLTAPLD